MRKDGLEVSKLGLASAGSIPPLPTRVSRPDRRDGNLLAKSLPTRTTVARPPTPCKQLEQPLGLVSPLPYP